MLNISKIIALILALTLMTVGCSSGSGANVSADAKNDNGEANTENNNNDGEDVSDSAPKSLRVASFNIKYGANAELDLGKIADIIKENDLDIVGIQEVDYKTTRSNGVDQPAVIAEKAGMNFYQFYRCIDYRGGQYGTLILSKHPIEQIRIYPLESGNKEARTLGYAKINVGGTAVDFFNTHLSYESKELRAQQIEQIRQIVSACDSFILTGDLNTSDFSEFDSLGGTLISRADRAFATFPSSNTAIDNIIFSERYTEKSAGMYETSYSDHNLLWAELSLLS